MSGVRRFWVLLEDSAPWSTGLDTVLYYMGDYETAKEARARARDAAEGKPGRTIFVFDLVTAYRAEANPEVREVPREQL